nr:hypothetical protein [Knoellia aerolata]
MSYPIHLWLEPGRGDTDLGLRARVADPVWFLTRQWQLGEHQGEDASSPVRVQLAPLHVPLLYEGLPDGDPTVVPAEALLETEPGQWWTIGRRIRLGRACAPLLPPGDAEKLRFGTLPAPYEALANEVDGRAAFDAGQLPGHAIWADVPAPGPDRWSERDLTYTADFTAAGITLAVNGHPGGDVDWFSVDADASTAEQVPPTPLRNVIPGRLDYPGAPHPRWWQIEDRAVDIGGFAPDRSHLATMLLLDIVLAHPDDWFSFPVPPPINPATTPSSGVLVQLGAVSVHDSFGEQWQLGAPNAYGPQGWSLFHTTGMAASDLVVWPVAVGAHSGPLLDEVLIGVDEDANLAWAVELRAEARQLLPDADTTAAVGETTRTGTRSFRYLPSTTLPNHWHPYSRLHADDPDAPQDGGDGRSGSWRQGVLADLTGPAPVPRPGPTSRLIGGPSQDGPGRGHQVSGSAIPSSGLRLQRRHRLARDAFGRPVLWVERQAQPLTGPPTSHLRFDVLAEDPAP